MHGALAAHEDDPAFAPEEPSSESLALFAAAIDEEISATFGGLPEDDALGAVAHRAEDLRDLVHELAAVGPAGLAIRTHGDYHLGQVLWSTDADWVVIDFEGEPARSLPERRRKRSPLRDLAGMTRSFAYAADASLLLWGVEAPSGWVEACREAFVEGYLASAGRAAAAAEPGGVRPPARPLRAREARLRAPLRGAEPARLGVDPDRGHAPHARGGRVSARERVRRARSPPDRRGSPRAPLGAASAHTPWTTRRACGSRSGRRTRGTCRWSATGTSGARAPTRSSRRARRASGRASPPTPARATHTSTRCAAPTASSATRPTRSRSGPSRLRARGRSSIARGTSGRTTTGSRGARRPIR